MSNQIAFSLIAEFSNARIESILAELFPEVSRRQFKKVVDRGLVNLNSRTASRKSLIKVKDQINFPADLLEVKLGSTRVNLDNFELEVLYEDEEMLVVNKPRKMHSVLINFDDPPTLADLVCDRFPIATKAGRVSTESGLVQRLDFYTSGLVTVAKNRKSWEELHELFLNKEVLKTYLAYVRGDLTKAVPNSTFDIKTIVKNGDSAILSLTTRLGGRHIVRETCASLGFPLVGDTEYGSTKSSFRLKIGNEIVEDDGFYLVANKISFLANSPSIDSSEYELNRKEITIIES